MWLYIKYCDGDLSFDNIESSKVPNFVDNFKKDKKYKVISETNTREAQILLSAGKVKFLYLSTKIM